MVYGIMVSMVSLKTVRTHGIWYHGIHGIDTNRQGRMVYGTHGTMVLLKGLGFRNRMSGGGPMVPHGIWYAWYFLPIPCHRLI